jgi:hypothetical protein
VRASVREESNLYAEATGLRPAGLTTCPTHGGVTGGYCPSAARVTAGLLAIRFGHHECSAKESNLHPLVVSQVLSH